MKKSRSNIIKYLTFIRLLSEKPHKTLARLADRMEASERTIFRYIEELREYGYDVQLEDSHYFITLDENQKNKVFFESEEVDYLQTILQTDENHPLRDVILNKIYYSSQLLPLTQQISRVNNVRKIRKLREAMTLQSQVILKNYHSANSKSISDRTVEPLSFHDNMNKIRAFETASQTYKTYSIERIDDVEFAEGNYTQSHEKELGSSEDVFGFGDGEWFEVELLITDLAFTLITEEKPMLKPFLTKDGLGDFKYRLKARFRNEKGIGRFILGLAQEVRVLAPENLQVYLNNKIKNLTF